MIKVTAWNLLSVVEVNKVINQTFIDRLSSAACFTSEVSNRDESPQRSTLFKNRGTVAKLVMMNSLVSSGYSSISRDRRQMAHVTLCVSLTFVGR